MAGCSEMIGIGRRFRILNIVDDVTGSAWQRSPTLRSLLVMPGEAVGSRVDRLPALTDQNAKALSELAVLVRFCEVK